MFIKIKNYDQYIDQSSMALKHELGHIVANDGENYRRAVLAVPIAMEAVCFGATYNFKKLRKILPPKTIIESLGRSVFAFSGLIPKVVCSLGIIKAYAQYQETQADKFACENAATKKELEVCCLYWKNQQIQFEQDCHSKLAQQQGLTEKELRSQHDKFDSVHPYPADRAKMAQEYSDRWDVEHPEDKQ